MKFCSYVILSFLMFTAPAFAGVSISQPANGATVGNPVQVVANGVGCWAGVASMGIYVNNVLKWVGTGSSINTSVGLDPGNYSGVIIEWDKCGGASTAAVAFSVTGQTGVFVSSPANNSTVTPTVNVAATASSSTCPQGVASMGVYVNNQLLHVQNGPNLNAQLNLSSGPQQIVTQAWDYCGGASSATTNVNVAGGGGGNVLSNLQAAGGWDVWGEYPPAYNICSGPCPGISWSAVQHVSNPSKSGNATQFTIGGSTPYSDVLWSNKIIGQGSTQGLPDDNRQLMPNLHNFIYDADVYVTNTAITQNLEFDVNMYINGVGMEWGTECNQLADGQWDIWDNVNAHWIPTGVACHLNNGWNHISFQVQRESNNDLLYQTITTNGQTANIYRTYAPFQVDSGWYGMTVNYQMDGNYNQAWNTTYIDNLNITYW